MSKRLSEITSSLRQIGEIQVTDWDFMGLLNKDLKDLEIGHSLRRLGNRKVMEWDYRNMMPAVQRFAHQEVDIVNLVRRAAHYKVMEWDFRGALPGIEETEAAVVGVHAETPSDEEIQVTIGRLKSFLEYATVNLIKHPDRAQIRIEQVQRCVVRFKLVVAQKDVKDLIGRDGQTAASIRSLMKATAVANGMHALLQILSHEEELALSLREAKVG